VEGKLSRARALIALDLNVREAAARIKIGKTSLCNVIGPCSERRRSLGNAKARALSGAGFS
jgi:hypothetical protein